MSNELLKCCKGECKEDMNEGELYKDYFVVEVVDWNSWVLCKKHFKEFEVWMGEGGEDKKLCDKKVSELTEDDVLDILVDMRDTEELTIPKWLSVLRTRFLVHNYLTEEMIEELNKR